MNWESVGAVEQKWSWDADKCIPTGVDAEGDWQIVGGGEGYPRTVNISEATVLVAAGTSGATFKTIVESATLNSVIYLADDANIDMTSIETVMIPMGVTLASGRGVSGSRGGRLFSNRVAPENDRMFDVDGPGVRITGLRIEGPYAGTGDAPLQTGVWIGEDARWESGDPVALNRDPELDNCEVYGWPGSAIAVNAARAQIHHNNIHHNQQMGWGYGVLAGSRGDTFSEAIVEWNLFNYNRHAIAGTGLHSTTAPVGYRPGGNYELRHNIFMWAGGTNHIVDMHGDCEENDSITPNVYVKEGGNRMVIEENMFFDALTSNSYVRFRGQPADPTTAVTKNRFFKASSGNSVVGAYLSNQPGCVQFAPGGINEHTITFTKTPNCFEGGGIGQWMVSNIRNNDFSLLAPSSFGMASLGFADFNGDGTTDVIRFATSTPGWFISHGGVGAWVPALNSARTRDEVLLGDFDGDGSSDVLITSGGEWRISSAATGSWSVIQSSGFLVDELIVGDFDGNGISDLLRIDGSQLKVSFGRSGLFHGGWNTVSTFGASGAAPSGPGTNVSDYLVGDFNGDGADDLFIATSSNWYRLLGRRHDNGCQATGTCTWSNSWSLVGASSVPRSSLLVANVDGDANDELVRIAAANSSTPARTYVSRDVQSGSNWVTHGYAPPTELVRAVGDFDGDGEDEMFFSVQYD